MAKAKGGKPTQAGKAAKKAAAKSKQKAKAKRSDAGKSRASKIMSAADVIKLAARLELKKEALDYRRQGYTYRPRVY